MCLAQAWDREARALAAGCLALEHELGALVTVDAGAGLSGVELNEVAEVGWTWVFGSGANIVE